MKVTFETGVLAEITKKAARIAPSKGAAFDKAAGLLMEIYPGEQEANVVVKATDTQVFFATWTNALEIIDGPPEGRVWRLPAQLLAQLTASLPATSGSSVTLNDESGRLEITCNKTRAQIAMMDPAFFPEFSLFDDSGLETVTGFTARISQVKWAAAEKDIPFCGIHLDGENMIATDRYRLAVVPCKVPVSAPITLPSEVVAPLIKDVADVRMAIYEGRLYMMPDEETQIVSITYAEDYPQTSRIRERFSLDSYPEKVRLSAESLRGKLERMMLFVKGDRFPRLDMTFGNERLYVAMSIEGVGFIDDEVDLTGQAIHDDVTISFGPRYIIDMLLNSPNDDVTMAYNPDNTAGMIYLNGGSGYQVWVMPRVVGDSPVRPG